MAVVEKEDEDDRVGEKTVNNIVESDLVAFPFFSFFKHFKILTVKIQDTHSQKYMNVLLFAFTHSSSLSLCKHFK